MIFKPKSDAPGARSTRPRALGRSPPSCTEGLGAANPEALELGMDKLEHTHTKGVFRAADHGCPNVNASAEFLEVCCLQTQQNLTVSRPSPTAVRSVVA